MKFWKSKFLGIPLMITMILSLLVAPFPAKAVLQTVGPVSETTGFPTWFQDQNGIALDLMEAADPFSISDPVDQDNSFSEQIGFNAEGFWWSAEASVENDGISALVVNALEAAFGGEEAVDGEQSAFGRVRFKIDVPVPGEYTVKHPFGTETFIVDEVEPGPEIQNVGPGGGEPDIGCFAQPGQFSCDPSDPLGTDDPRFNFNAVLESNIGPFLTWDTFDLNPQNSDPLLFNPLYPNRRYIGNPQIEHEITGSPVGQNFFEVTGPGGIKARTELFTVSGRLADTVAPVIENVATDPSPLKSSDLSPKLLVTASDDMTGVHSIIADLSPLGGSLAVGTLVSGTGLNGTWQIDLPELTTGNYTLIIDAIDGGGNTVVENFELVVLPPGPIINEIAPVPQFTNDTTPDYTFSSDQAGAISYGGVCTSTTSVVSIGENTINLTDSTGSPFEEGVKSCFITVTNDGGISTVYPISEFTVDLTPPVITLIGNATVNHNVNTPYVDAGATALDNFNGDLTGNMIVLNNVDPAMAGNYIVTYNVSDLAGNAAVEVVRAVRVGSPPVITVSGFNPLYIQTGNNFVDPGATSVDLLDGLITPSSTNDVNTNSAGNYNVLYTSTNSQGFVATSSRSVIVYDLLTAPEIIIGVGTPTSLALSWVPSTGGVSTIFYSVYRDSVLLTTTAQNVYTDTGLTPSTSYSYMVVATDSLPASQGGPNIVSSTPIIGTTAEDTDAPSAPTSLSANSISASQIDLSWVASIDNVVISQYRIYRNVPTSTITSTTTPSSVSLVTNFSDTGLSASTVYTYAVAAVDSSGNLSQISELVSTTTQPAPVPVVNTGGGGGGGGGVGGSYTLPPSQPTPIPLLINPPLIPQVLGERVDETGATTTPTQNQTLIVKPKGLNVRSEASVRGKLLGTVLAGSRYLVIESSNGWHKIEYRPGALGWVSGSFVTLTGPAPFAVTQIGTITANLLRVRNSGSLDGAIIGHVAKGLTFAIKEKKNNWYRIDYNGKNGWISGAYVSIK